MIKKIITGIAGLLLYTMLMAQTLKNPMVLDNEWGSYGIGDPYILKYRGIFYLYSSTKDHNNGIKCWSSKNLTDWEYMGYCSTDPVTTGAYAPEIIYWNGMFYMYTSPAGNGHYVLSSDSPIGPFTAITPNIGKSIDGSVFIDDDAKWYFYHASGSGIQGCSMSDPATINASLNLNARMNNNWTEGSCTFKRNGKYYMIYTGNHVISKGYRIDYATNTDGPISAYTPAEIQNPILVNSMGNHVGLGHGSVFIGPDLDSYFLTYHNLLSANGPFRRFNLDRIAWNGDKMMVLGPTNTDQPAPEMPDGYDYFDRSELGSAWSFYGRGRWGIASNDYLYQDTTISGLENWFLAVLNHETAKNYTAEFNLAETWRENDNSATGAVFAYIDEKNYGIAAINNSTKKLEVNFLADSAWGNSNVFDIPGNLNFSNWHTLRIEKLQKVYKFFIGPMLIATIEGPENGGKTGYFTYNTKARFGFIAASNKVNGSGIFDIYKPVPGTIDATQYITGGEGAGYHKKNYGTVASENFRNDSLPMAENPRGGYAIASFENGDWLCYAINAASETFYNLAVSYSAASAGSSLRVFVDGSDISGQVLLPETGGADKYRTCIIKNLAIPKGHHLLKIESTGGTVGIYSMQFVYADNADFDKQDNFEGTFSGDWKYFDGAWSFENKAAKIDGFGKRAFGSAFWCDYTVETDIRFVRNMNAGILLRVNNPAIGGAGDDAQLGTDYLQGYFVGFNSGQVVLGKHNYGWQFLASSSGSFKMNTWYRLKATVVQDTIRVYVDNMLAPAITYIDSMPFINGRAGFRSFNTNVQFDNFRVYTIKSPSHTENIFNYHENSFLVYPNPASGVVTIVSTLGESLEKIKVFNSLGELVFTSKTSDDEFSVPLHQFPKGIYMLQVSEKAPNTSKIIVY
ncbi:MAG: family 43 glycosylhydrolase [Bacteroidales bacterium]|nr:family 43 glycosylhydrolase [Bacteroidales bacterium]